MKSLFGSKELEKCLTELGFIPQRRVGSSHLKYKITGKKIPAGIRPFIIIIEGRKVYDPHTASSYIRQIKNLGFTEEEILKNL